MHLIIGLGNPGKGYERTRHNAGFMAVRAFRDAHADAFGGWSRKFQAEASEGRVGGDKVVLLLPQTFMNVSGQSVAEAAAFWKVAPENVILVHDDLDLPLGTLRVRPDGSAGGHNGVKSVIAALGKQNFPRVRLGIATPIAEKVPAEDFVLQRFGEEEAKVIDDAVARAADALDAILADGLDAAMNRFN
jgi:PTH1 family peptidyl-tRNA hydrolase